MELLPGQKIGTATLITGVGYLAIFRCECGNVFTVGRRRVNHAIFGGQQPYEKPSSPVPLYCPVCENKVVNVCGTYLFIGKRR